MCGSVPHVARLLWPKAASVDIPVHENNRPPSTTLTTSMSRATLELVSCRLSLACLVHITVECDYSNAEIEYLRFRAGRVESTDEDDVYCSRKPYQVWRGPNQEIR